MNEEIKRINDQNGDAVGQNRTDGREEKGIQLKKHIIRADLREIHEISGNGDRKCRHGGQKQMPCARGFFKRMISRSQHHDGTEKKRAVIEKGVKSRKRNARASAGHRYRCRKLHT